MIGWEGSVKSACRVERCEQRYKKQYREQYRERTFKTVLGRRAV